MTVQHLETERLLLRRWREEDRAPFAALNADPTVMEYFPAPLARDQSDAFVDRIEAHFDSDGFGLWAVEVRSSGDFAGYVGLWPATFDAPFTPAVEVGWRLAKAHWVSASRPKPHTRPCMTVATAWASTRSSRSPRPTT